MQRLRMIISEKILVKTLHATSGLIKILLYTIFDCKLINYQAKAN